jgi:hypothetical protein
MRCRAAVFWALFRVMIISSGRVGPRLLTWANDMTKNARES